MATRPPGHPATRPPGHPATRPPGHPATYTNVPTIGILGGLCIGSRNPHTASSGKGHTRTHARGNTMAASTWFIWYLPYKAPANVPNSYIICTKPYYSKAAAHKALQTVYTAAVVPCGGYVAIPAGQVPWGYALGNPNGIWVHNMHNPHTPPSTLHGV